MKAQIDNLLATVRACIESGQYRQTAHAIARSCDRNIPLPDILYALKRGRRNENFDHYDYEFAAWNYAIEGRNSDGISLRIVVSFDDSRLMLIITVIDLI